MSFDPATRRQLALREWIFLGLTILFWAGFVILMGKDTSWDFRNYHWYNPYQLLNGRMSMDVAVAHLGSYYNPFLDVPFYLHPRNPWPGSNQTYVDHPWLIGPTWQFAIETSAHALRLIGSGLFDAHPRLRIILGHLGEGLTFYLWRLDNRNNWMKKPNPYAAKKRVADYFRSNFHVTTSGHYSTPAFMNAITEIGVERVMFSVDYPFEDISDAATWFDALPLGEADRRKIGRTNALRLFNLPGA